MAAEVVWSRAAARDLDDIASFIARGSIVYAARFVNDVQEVADSLVKFPGRGRVVPEIEEDAVRELIVGQYRLIYEVTGSTVHILALVHGARDLGIREI